MTIACVLAEIVGIGRKPFRAGKPPEKKLVLDAGFIDG
jgi:hypothetical protein